MDPSTDPSPTERFTSRAEAYAQGRPGYPREILTLLKRECGLKPALRIADIGSGTGLLSELFLNYGCEVFGVEPNAAMRSTGERMLKDQPRFHSIDGRAEATGLADRSVDLVTAGQAFHWFDPQTARAEFQRIARPGGCVALIWNERRITPGFMTEHETVQQKFAGERQHPGSAEFDAFFGLGAWRQEIIPNPVPVDEATLLRRVESCSRSPLPGDPRYDAMMSELRRIFQKHATDGQVQMEYETRIYWGPVG